MGRFINADKISYLVYILYIFFLYVELTDHFLKYFKLSYKIQAVVYSVSSSIQKLISACFVL